MIRNPFTITNTRQRLLDFVTDALEIKNNRKRKNKRNSKQNHRNARATAKPLWHFTSRGEYHPRKHPVQGYAAQNRAARKRKKAKR